ncbi:hypothetical protein [Sinorhizobium meliloti]|uniref:hypothetical protein n=1 Tax=Rhizobium meliloti TaxID=382 RepID=UPI001F3CB2C9|nr:hypothetical protein [Sinorhizobium meliloti]
MHRIDGHYQAFAIEPCCIWLSPAGYAFPNSSVSLGLRVSELVGLALDQFDGRSPASIHIICKGRRERVLPLWQDRCRDPRLDRS